MTAVMSSQIEDAAVVLGQALTAAQYEYADAGIVHYWRVETKPAVVVVTYHLGENGSYFQSGEFSEGDITAVPGLPWAKMAVADLAP